MINSAKIRIFLTALLLGPPGPPRRVETGLSLLAPVGLDVTLDGGLDAMLNSASDVAPLAQSLMATFCSGDMVTNSKPQRSLS